jgi:uncharacterized C2H2 Zn-finger protein
MEMSSVSSECQFCDKLFKQKKDLYAHLRKAHNHEPLFRKGEYECGECGEKFTQACTLKRHIRESHKMQTQHLKCEYCPIIFGNKETFQRHLQEKHNVKGQPKKYAYSFKETQSSNKRFFRTYQSKVTATEIDVDGFLMRNEENINNLINSILTEEQTFKIQLTVGVTMTRELVDEDINMVFNSFMREIYPAGLEEETFDRMKDRIVAQVEEFTQHGSGWIVKSINYLDVNFAKFKPMRGGSYIQTPIELQDNNFLLNIKTSTPNCFELCLLAAKHPLYVKTDHPGRSSSYKNFNDVNMCGVENPVKLSDIGKIERANGISINVFGYEDHAYPLRISDETGSPVDLLLLSVEDSFHYCLIRNYTGFMRHESNQSDQQYYYCRRCMHGCKGIDAYKNHKILCQRNSVCRIEMPVPGKDEMCWRKLSARASVPFVVYADLEAITAKVQGCTPDPANSFTQNLEKQVPCGACAVLVDSEGVMIDEFLHRGEDCIKELFVNLRTWAKRVYWKKRKFPVYKKKASDNNILESATRCWICEEKLEDNRVFEHDHVTGTLRGIAHKECNSALKTAKNLPVFFHNGSGYDFKHLLKQYKAAADEIIECIPSTEQTYTSFNVRVPADHYRGEDGSWINIYEDLVFLDSYKFLSKSLEKLVVTHALDRKEFKTLRSGFTGATEANIQLLHRKGVYPYSYMDSFARFIENELPPKWTDVLSGKMVNDEDYAHAKDVREKFSLKNL